MRTYQDLLQAGENENSRAQFVHTAINSFIGSQEYREAAIGESYYHFHNVTIENYKKWLYNLAGQKEPDNYSANYKLKTGFFRRLVIQQVLYVLGQGVTFREEDTKERLGMNFDNQLIWAATRAMAAGRSFGFWNYDHLEVFGYADTKNEPGFCPLYDEKTGDLAAGIRFWYKDAGDKKILKATLYEPDGYSEYIKGSNDSEMELTAPKRGYIITTVSSQAGGVEEIIEENYPGLPIIPLYANDSKESEINGVRESIDCYDLVKSGMANNIDDASDIYWTIKNAGGMHDKDLAKFLQRVKTVRAVTLDSDDGEEAEPHTIDVPVEARTAMLEILRRDIYEDFQALDVQTLSAAQKTTQEIQAAYQTQDNKCALFESYLKKFVNQILSIVGIDDEPTFSWNKIINQAEQTSMILSAANYLTDEAIIKHLPFITPEEADDIIAQRDLEQIEEINTFKENVAIAEEEMKAEEIDGVEAAE